MENQNFTNHRIKNLEKVTDEQNIKIGRIDDSVRNLSERENERYIQVSNLGSRLEESYKNQREIVKELTTSINGLVEEMKETNKTHNDQLNQSNDRFTEIEKQIIKLDKDKKFHAVESTGVATEPEGNSLGNTQKGAIVLGILGTLEVFIRYVAPLFFS